MGEDLGKRLCSTSIGNVQMPILNLLPHLYAQYGQQKVQGQLCALESHGSAVDDPILWLRTALAHDFKFVPIERVDQCLCGSRFSVLLCRFIYWNLLALRQCQDCGLLFVSPRLTSQAMRSVFNDSYFDYSDPEFWRQRRMPIFQDILRLIVRYKCRSVFDVGAGFGYFVKWLKSQAIEASGCDISAKAVQWGRDNLGVSLYEGSPNDLKLPANSVDCVVSLDTVYYMTNPVAQLRAIRQLVKPGGLVILRLRNGLGSVWRARIEGRKAVGKAVLPSEHLWAFTPKTINHLMRLSNLEPILCEPAAYSTTPLNPIHVAWVRVERLICSEWFKAPILTRSFNLVSVRQN